MEELNKSQIVLLTLLVSFVTSMATGIVTVSLMEQGVSPVTTTVNKIVERTKEIIIREIQDPITVTKTETIVVHPSDLVANAVDKNKDSSIIIYKVVSNTPSVDVAIDEMADENTLTTITALVDSKDQIASAITAIEDTVIAELPKDKLIFASRGVVLEGGVIVSDASIINNENEYIVLDALGERIPVILQRSEQGIAILYSNIGIPTTIGNISNLKRGEAIIVLSGADRLKVITSVVSDIITNDSGIALIEIDKIISTPGSMLINSEGELIGISTGISRTSGNAWFSSSNIIEASLLDSEGTGI